MKERKGKYGTKEAISFQKRNKQKVRDINNCMKVHAEVILKEIRTRQLGGERAERKKERNNEMKGQIIQGKRRQRGTWTTREEVQKIPTHPYELRTERKI
jgi:Zn-finger protein